MQQARETNEGAGGANVEYEGETVIAEVGGVSTGVGHQTVFLEAAAALTTNAGTTETTLRIRRNNLTGPVVATLKVKPGASAILSVSVQGSDTPGVELANANYVLTAQETAAVKGKSVGSRIAATY